MMDTARWPRAAFHRFYQRHWKRFQPFKMAEWDTISHWLDARPDMVVLDVACGNGYFSRRIAAKGCRVVGIDMSWDGVMEAQRHNRNTQTGFALADALHLPFEGEVFDAAVSVCALEHFSDDVVALKEIHRVLKPGGQLVMTVDSLSYQGMDETFRHACMTRHDVVHTYRADDLKQLLEVVGFEVDAMRYLFNSAGSSAAFRLATRLHWLGIDLLDPVLYPLLRPLAKLSDRFFGRDGEGYALAAAARKRD